MRPIDGRNAACLITVYGKNNPQALDPAFLRTLLTNDSAPWIANTADHQMTVIHELAGSIVLVFES